MQKLEVLIQENAFGSVRPVEVVVDVPLSALVPALVEELRLPQTDHFGKKFVYMLRSAPEGRILSEHTTLMASGVKPGTRLVLDSYVVDGSVAALMHNTQQQQQAEPAFHSSTTIADSNSFPVIGRKNTSAHLPAVKKKRRWTRRAFLLAGGLSLGSAGIGYAAYHSLSKGAATPSMMRSTTPPNTAVPVKLLNPTMARPLLSFARHRQTVRTLSWSPDGTLLASGADDTQLFIWGTDGAIHQGIQHGASVRALAWSPDGQRLVTGAANQVLFLNALTGAPLSRSTHRHTAMVMSLAWSSHNQMQVVSGGLDTHAIVWNTTDYQAQTTFTRHTTAVESVSWSADGQTVASSSFGGAVRVWSATNGQEVHGFYLDAKIPMRVLAFAPSGMQLAVGGDDGKVRLWNGLMCQQQAAGNGGNQCMDIPQRLQASHRAVRSLAWSPDARLLATGGDDGTIAIWYPGQNQKPLLTIQQNASIHSIAWSPGGSQLATASGNVVTVWGLS